MRWLTRAPARTVGTGLAGLLRQSVFGRLAGYEDVNDAERLCRDPAMRWSATGRSPPLPPRPARCQTKWLSRPENLVALADLPGQWIEKVHQRRPPKTIVLDMDSSESPTYGEQEGSAYNGHSAAPAITRYSCSTSSAMSSGALCDLVTSIALMTGA